MGAEAAVTAWRRHLITAKASPSTVNQALAAVDLLYEVGAGLRLKVKRARVPRPAEPDALTPKEQGMVERAADRRGVRDAAIVAVLLYTGARVEERARLDLDDLAFTARTGTIRLYGKGDEVATCPSRRPPASGSPPGSATTTASRARCGSASVVGSPPRASPRSRSLSVPTLACLACDPIGCGTPTPPGSAGAVPTRPRFKPCSGTPPSTPPPATSGPAPPSRPPSSSGSSSRWGQVRCNVDVAYPPEGEENPGGDSTLPPMSASSSLERLVAPLLDDEFRKFVESHYSELLGTAYLLCGSKHAAEDAVQSALLRSMRHWSGITDPTSYVRRVMVTQRISRWRRASRLREYLAEALPERHVPDETEMIGARDELFRALAALPPRTRAVVVLRYWEDLSEAETARVLKCSAGTVKSHASRGLARLRAALTERG